MTSFVRTEGEVISVDKVTLVDGMQFQFIKIYRDKSYGRIVVETMRDQKGNVFYPKETIREWIDALEKLL